MKKFIFVIPLSFIVCVNADYDGEVSPCENATWISKTREFSINARPRGLRPGTTFHAVFGWQQRSLDNFICKLKDPYITIDGARFNEIAQTWTYENVIISYEIHDAVIGDKMRIDGSVVDTTLYQVLVLGHGQIPFETTTSVLQENRVALIAWRANNNPYFVGITGPEGDEIEISHTSKEIYVTEVTDAVTGDLIIILDGKGAQMWPGREPLPWPINHFVSVSK